MEITMKAIPTVPKGVIKELKKWGDSGLISNFDWDDIYDEEIFAETLATIRKHLEDHGAAHT